MKKTGTLEELIEFASGIEGSGETLINQANHHTGEPILSDEDVAGKQTLQLLRVLVLTDGQSVYYEYPFIDGSETEEVMLQLEKVFDMFPKKVVDQEEMNRLLTEQEEE